MGNKKLNFRNPLEVEKYIFKIMEDLAEGKASANIARAASQLANSWLKAHEGRKIIEFEHRLNYLEVDAGLKKAGPKRTGRPKKEGS